MPMRTLDIWDSRSAHAVTWRVFIVWEPPPLTYFKVNFVGNVIDSYGGVGFVIQGSDSRLVVANGIHLLSPLSWEQSYG